MSAKEEWRSVDGHPSWEVSTFGRVRKNGGVPDYGKSSGKGGLYRRVTMDGEHKAVHRLVLETFVGPPTEVASSALHRNDVANDNRLSNLYWGTSDENVADRRRNRGTLMRLPKYEVACRTIGAWAPIEVADMLQVYARKHNMTQSQAIVELLAKGLRLPKPETRSVGRPKAS